MNSALGDPAPGHPSTYKGVWTVDYVEQKDKKRDMRGCSKSFVCEKPIYIYVSIYLL